MTISEQFPGHVSHHPINPDRGELAPPDRGPLEANAWFPDLVDTERRLDAIADRGPTVTAAAGPAIDQADDELAWFPGSGTPTLDA